MFLRKIIKGILIVSIGFPMSIFVRIIKPIVFIRFGFFYGTRIGHFSFDVEYYLGEIEKENINSFDIFFVSKPVANNYFIKLISRKVLIFEPIKFAFYANKYFPNYKEYEYLPAVVENGVRDLKGYIKNTSKHLHFSNEEDVKGQQFIDSISTLNTKKFVCLNIRDSAYLKSKYPEHDWSRGDYRFSDLNSYKKTIEYLTSQNYLVIRMGQITEGSFSEIKGFYDYSKSKNKSEFLDIWLMANCNFAISTSSGLDSICNIFRRPIAFVNSLPLSHIPEWNPKIVFTPKTILERNTNRKLSLSEVIKKDLVGYRDDTDYVDIFDKQNCTYVNNKEDEILETVKELIENIDADWSRSKKTTEDQAQFWSIFQKWEGFDKNFNINDFPEVGSISNTYIDKNRDWFLK